MTYQPTSSSLKSHQVPEWYHDAKLGIFIHWGLYSVPAFAVTDEGDMQAMIARKGIKYFYTNNPYAEWYLNSTRIPKSPADLYHLENYGAQFSYDEFEDMFNDQSRSWNPNEWADIFASVGAQYAVITSRHHDGFRMWPSDQPHPKKKTYTAARDIVGELKTGLESRGLKLGIYYSGILDWSFTPKYILTFADLVNNGTISQDYVKYADQHYRELIEKYHPWELWNDIGYPPGTNLKNLFAYYYNTVPEGVIDDRWVQFSRLIRWGASLLGINAMASWLVQHFFIRRPVVGPTFIHCDFRTPEYSVFEKSKREKWELTRGIGNSFGYNQFEGEKDYIAIDKLIRLFVDLVSKNGNMLLNIGPKPDGTIPEIQQARLKGLGDWLKMNGEGIFGTRPWIRAQDISQEKIPVRFTAKGKTIYVFLLQQPSTPTINLNNFQIPAQSTIQILGIEQDLAWNSNGNRLILQFPSDLSPSPVYGLRISSPST